MPGKILQAWGQMKKTDTVPDLAELTVSWERAKNPEIKLMNN